jgi:Beta-lactamase superfamily domain
VSDPWWAGSAYTDQWHPWPTPAAEGLESRPIDVLYLSHGHEDHLHTPTLARLGRGSTVLVPAFVTGGMDGYVRSLGFERVVALRHGQRAELGGGVTATCYVNATDSLLVVEDGDEVLVNANDALHAAPAAIADHFCDLLLRNHPRITSLFLGYGGASWFPNCLRLPGKDDRAAALRREQLLADNFARIVARLSPRLACAFAASFVLLEPANRWVNEVKLEAPGPDEAFRRRAGGSSSTACRLLAPGDVVDGAAVEPGGRTRPRRADLERACGAELRAACERLERAAPLSVGTLGELALEVEARLRASRRARGRPLELDLRIREAPDAAIRLCTREGATARLRTPRADVPALELRHGILRALLDEPYGAESITIGCGATAHLQDGRQLADVLAAIALLSPRTGSWRGIAAELRRDPWAVSSNVVAQRWPLVLHAGVRAGLIESLQGATLLG